MGRFRKDSLSLEDLGKQIKVVKDEKTRIEARYNELRDEALIALEEEGTENDKGSFTAKFADITLIKQKTVSTNLNHTALEVLLKQAGLWDACTKTVTVIDEDAVMAALFQEKLDEEAFEACVERRVSWRLLVK